MDLAFMRTPHPGNSLTEYGFIGASILVACIAVLMMLGSNIDAGLARLQGDVSTNVTAAREAEAQAAAARATALIQQASEENGLGLDTTELSRQLATSGANGATTQLANQMAQSIQELQAQGKLDPAQANLLLRLANQGHEIAQVMSLLESAAAAAGNDPVKFENTSIIYNGKTYTPKTLGLEIGWRGAQPADIAKNGALALAAWEQPGDVLNEFLNIYAQAERDGSLNDPAVKSIISNLTSQIVVASESVETFTCNNESLFTPDMMTSTVASAATHANSGGICTTGGNSDNGQKCQ